MNRIAGKPTELKNVNISLILNSIRDRGNATRGEISKDTGLSHTTVRAILNELIEINEIISVGLDESSGGRRAERYKVNSNKRYILAISIEEDKAIYRIVNTLGEVLEEKIEFTSNLEDIENVVNIVGNFYKNYHNIEGIGISVPGVVTDDGYLSGIRMEDWKEIKIRKYLKEKFNLPILLENDINSASLAFYNEYIEKNKCDSISLVYISFTSLGVGSGIIINGNVLKGDNGYAGEIGFIPIENTFLNTVMSSELDDDKYVHVIINIIKTISSIINPSVVVLGGSNFRYSIKNEIKDKYTKEFSINTEILIEEEKCNYSLEGIKEEALKLINKEVKLIKN
ncbi:ROK family protein [Clostridium sp. AL.422]|uniref:ROK family protein n=1 Tax=Clostridium TaxID=1485 RepID=UPI00293DF60D|nr:MULTISPECIES: ROK family protein [unclassified Clostridium]MDV4150529.1 ROK family protein [Clostridium sp. AL.422]